MPSLLTCRETLFACLPRRRWPTRAVDLGKESRVGRSLVGAATAGRLSCRRRCRCGGGSVLDALAPRGMSGGTLASIHRPDWGAAQFLGEVVVARGREGAAGLSGLSTVVSLVGTARL